MKKKDLDKRLKQLGWWLKGGTKHEKWTNGEEIEMVPRHKEIDEMLARKIIKTASKYPGKGAKNGS